MRTKLYLQECVIPLINGFGSKEECSIKNTSLSSKIFKFKKFHKDLVEELQEQGQALAEKWVVPKTFELDEKGLFKSGSKGDYLMFLKENSELLSEEIADCDITFSMADFEGSEIAHWILNLLDDFNLLVEPTPST